MSEYNHGEEIAAINERLAEIESRLAEAGRRALFHSKQAGQFAGGGRPETFLADIGRALLFDPETPDRVKGDDDA